MTRTVISGIILFAIIWFAVSNATAVSLNVFFWNVSVSAALVIFITFLVGFIFGVLRVAPYWFRKHAMLGKQEKESKKRIKNLEGELAEKNENIQKERNSY